MFCSKCGAPCGENNAPRFCRKCGAPLADAVQKEATRPEADRRETGTALFAAAQATEAAVPPKKKKKKLWGVFVAIAALTAAAIAITLFFALRANKTEISPDARGGADAEEQTGAVDPLMIVSGLQALFNTKSCDFDLLAENGSVHVTGTAEIADDLMESCAILRLPDADGQESYVYLHEGRLMLTRGSSYLTGLNVKGLAEKLSDGDSTALDTVLRFFNLETADLTYQDCVVLAEALGDVIHTLQTEPPGNERLNSVFSSVMEAAIPLLKLREAKELAEQNKDNALKLAENFLRAGISEEAMRLTGGKENGRTVFSLTITPVVFFKEAVAFCSASAQFAAICENLQTTPEEVLAPYTDEALQNAFGDNRAVLRLGITENAVDTVALDYGETQVFTLTLSAFDTAAVDTARYEFIEDMRAQPALYPDLENNYIDNYLDILKQLF